MIRHHRGEKFGERHHAIRRMILLSRSEKRSRSLAQQGASLLEITNGYRHKQIAMVRRYAHLSVASKSTLVDRVHRGVGLRSDRFRPPEPRP
jgi:hypothetical protein